MRPIVALIALLAIGIPNPSSTNIGGAKAPLVVAEPGGGGIGGVKHDRAPAAGDDGAEVGGAKAPLIVAEPGGSGNGANGGGGGGHLGGVKPSSPTLDNTIGNGRRAPSLASLNPTSPMGTLSSTGAGNG